MLKDETNSQAGIGYFARPARLLQNVGLLLLALMPTSRLDAQTAQVGRHALRLEQVVGALSAAMLPLGSAEVRLLAQISTSIEDPKLEIKALEPWGDHGARIRLRCETHEQCIPFYVSVDWADAPTAQAALHAASPARTLPASAITRPAKSALIAAVPAVVPASGRPVDQPAYAAGAAAALKSSPAFHNEREPAASGSAVAASATIHAGAHATLVLDGSRLHIKVPVICLENGNTGRTIRVTATDHKQVYQAEIVDSNLLKGTL